MKWILVLVVALLFVGSASATPVNFTDWAAYGNAWKANNDTHVIVKWNTTGLSSQWVSDGNATNIEILIVAGGGSNGGGVAGVSQGGHGGAGGLLYGTAAVNGTYNITIGSGGAGVAASTQGNNGQNSSFSNLSTNWSAIGGGGGGKVSGTAGSAGNNGGSGGGGGAGSSGTHTGGTATQNSQTPLTGYGNNGGLGSGAGGGGGGGAGGAASGVTPGNNKTIGITGTAFNYSWGGMEGITPQNNETGNGGWGTSSTNLRGADGVVIISYASGSSVLPVAGFTCTPTSTTLGTPISCTDTSSDTPTNWTYIWGDGNITTTEQNPTYTYPFTGTFTINMSANNTVGIDWENKTNYITITNASSFVQQDIYLTGQYNITFIVKSSTTNLPIANVTVVDAVSGQVCTTVTGTCYLTEPAGLIYVNFIADGYQSKQVTYVVDQDEVHEVKMVPSAAAPTRSISNWYSPHQVRFAVVDSMGVKVVGSTINASAIATTLPTDGTADWLTAMYGIDPDAANDMMNGTLIMHGITQSDGATVFTMHSSIGYSLAVTNPSNGVIQTVNVTPIDTIYTIHLIGTAANNTYMDMGYNTSLYITEPDVHNVTMNLAYQDMSARTTLLEFFVLARSNNTVINYQSTSSIGNNVILMNYTVPNVRPDRYSWYYNAVRVK